jgi:hypothetical protein
VVTKKGIEMRRARCIITIIFTVTALAAGVTPAAAGDIKVSYLYKLANFTGVIPYASPKIFVDKASNEIYVMTGAGLSIFNSTGMEIYRADTDPEVGMIHDAAVDGDGNVITLTSRNGAPVITLCNYRLEPLRSIELTGLPAEFSGFRPSQLRLHDGRLYLAGHEDMAILIVDLNGKFIKGYDLRPLVGKDDKGREITDMDGFNLDRDGNMIFVLPVFGRACKLSPDGTLEMFGKRGNGPGKFGIPGWIVADRAGNYLVCDRLKNIVIIFNKELKFVKEFGALGKRETYLAVPVVMEMDGDGKLYIGQVGRRGINVYWIESES